MEHLIGLDFKNFQSLADTQLNLDPGLNVIVGPSNLGKSAAIRALKALVYNAAATGLIREGARELEVTAWFADGQKISLVKGKNKSEYYWNDAVYAKSGANAAPEIIQQQWAIATPDGRQLSFASQHEPPFLLSEPSSAVAKVLGDLTNAAMLMEAVGVVNRGRKAATTDATVRQREADEARDELLTHKGIGARGEALVAARAAFNSAQKKVAAWEQLVQFSEAFTKLEQEQKVNNLTELSRHSLNLEKAQVKVDDAVGRLTVLQDLQKSYNDLVLKRASYEAQVSVCQEVIDETEQELHNLLEQSGTCPLCGKGM